MLKVIIADDEERVSRLVLMIVDWDALGMEVIGTATNGLQAIELVERLRPDILVSDIRMPGCDGLELVRKAKAVLPQLQIALISGYAEFEYAQTALSYDVGGYILKPIKKEIITATLEKLGNKCREQSAIATTAEQLLQDSRKSNEILRGRLFEDLLMRRVLEPSRELLRAKYGLEVADGLLQTFIIKIDCSYELVRSRPMDVIRKKVEEVFESLVSPLNESFAFQMNPSIGYGILNYKEEKQAQIRRALREYLNQLDAHRFSGAEFSLAIGKAVDRVEKLPASMHNAQIAIAERLVEGTGRVLETSLADAQPGSRKIVEKYARSMERVADMLSEEEADRAVDEMASITRSAGLHGYELQDLVMSAARMFALRLNMDGDDALPGEFREKCELCGSVGKLIDCLRFFLKEQIKAVRGRLENEAIRPIRIARQYVMEHFSEPITLADVCVAAGFSVSYFSKMFKEETGEGFSRYLARVRIDEAKALLRETGLPVAEICEMVGYNDIKHFVATFKKMTSLNPGQYRKLYG